MANRVVNYGGKIKRHNARQSIQRLATESALMQQKLRDHLESGGLHYQLFDLAETHMSEASQSLRKAVEALS